MVLPPLEVLPVLQHLLDLKVVVRGAIANQSHMVRKSHAPPTTTTTLKQNLLYSSPGVHFHCWSPPHHSLYLKPHSHSVSSMFKKQPEPDPFSPNFLSLPGQAAFLWPWITVLVANGSPCSHITPFRLFLAQQLSEPAKWALPTVHRGTAPAPEEALDSLHLPQVLAHFLGPLK